MSTAYIALGSNIGDRLGNLAMAVEAISEIPDTHVERASHAYESEPAYETDQPRFANAVVEVTSDLEADQLLGYLQGIEDEMGRLRGLVNAPRIIDLDILLFGDNEIATDRLVIPHPKLLERDFVVTPLLDIAPRLHLPDGRRITREGATEGVVVADLGSIADLGAIHNEPVLAQDWVPVAESTREQDVVAGWDSGLAVQREALDQAGIAYAWDPYEPEAAMDPFGMGATFKLLVPKADELRARQLLADVMAAEPIFPAELMSGSDE